MFKKEYQGGPHIEIFSAQGRDPVSRWKLTGSVKKEYDKLVRGYVYVLEGGASTTTTRMQLPKADKALLCLLQPCIVFQLQIPDSHLAKLAIDLSILDSGGGRRRIHLSSSQRELNATPLNARIPLGELLAGQWMNLCVDLDSLVQMLFKGSSFKSLEGISLGGSCRLRRVFTLQTSPSNDQEEDLHSIPRAFHMSTISLRTRVVSARTWKAMADSKLSSSASVTSDSSSHSASTDRPTHVAFGQKVAIPDHILSSRQSTRQDDLKGKEAGSVNPHPPLGPVDQSLLRIQKTRVRMISGKSSRKTVPSKSSPIPRSSYSSHNLPVDTAGRNSELVVPGEAVMRPAGGDSGERPASDKECERLLDGDIGEAVLTHPQETISSPSPHEGGTVLASDEQLALDVLSSERNSSMQSRENLSPHRTDEQVYSYHSAPKSAKTHLPNLTVQENTSRGARLEEDFVSPREPKSYSAGDNLWETRLSDDYDWRQYASHDAGDISPAAEESLRTRLASHRPGSTHNTTPDTGSSGMEDTLSESMTLSGWTEHFKNATRTPFLESLDTRGMGGMLSPAVLDGFGVPGVEDQDGEGGVRGKEAKGEGVGTEELELMYDPQLNCFYDPVTYKYYELIQPD